MAEEVCGIISALALPHSGSSIEQTVTLSAGAVSLIPSPQISSEDFVAAADRALYQAKAKGRNVFCLAP